MSIPTTHWTRNDISELIFEGTETETPDRVLEALEGLHGKQITTRILAKLPGGKAHWRLRRQYGMTHLENEPYWSNRMEVRNAPYKHGGVTILLGHFETAEPLDVTAIEGLNPSYYEGRRARNHKRMEARNDAALLERSAEAMNGVIAARQALADALEHLETLTGYDKPLSPDNWTIRRACGAK